MKPRAMSEAESESFGFINFDGRNPGVCWHLNESLERCHEPDTGTTARRCAKHAKGRDHEIQREREKKRWLQLDERRVRAGLDANKRGYKVKKHTWAVSKLAESTVTGELFPVGWTCTECGLRCAALTSVRPVVAAWHRVFQAVDWLHALDEAALCAGPPDRE